MKSKRLRPHKFAKRKISLKILLLLILMCATGTIIYQNKDYLYNLPRLYFINDLPLNPYNADKKQQIINLLSRYDIYAVSIKSLPAGMEVILDTGTQIFFPLENLEKNVASLQLILNRFTIEGRKVKYIDLRYSKAIIK